MVEVTKAEGQKPFKVLKVDELTRLTDMGGVESYYRVTFRTRGGTTLTTEVSQRDYTPDKVNKILTDLAVNSDKILTL